MNVKSLIRKYLQTAQIMQLATAVDNQPWACSVHIAVDEHLNVYWISSTERRHSKEIAANIHVAATVPVKFPEHPVVGVSVEGDAEIVAGDILQRTLDIYDKKHGLSPDFKDKVLAGQTPHKFYCLKPRLFALFDEENFPDNPRQEWQPK